MSFLYTALNIELKEFRLLDVEPAPLDAPVHAVLRHVSFAASPRPIYEAVSYVWGDRKERAEITLNGQIVDVPRSSEEVLRYLRLQNKQRTLWIDALCINQDDLQERSQQVALMGTIYRNTVRTLAWVGSRDEEWEILETLTDAGDSSDSLGESSKAQVNIDQTSEPRLADDCGNEVAEMQTPAEFAIMNSVLQHMDAQMGCTTQLENFLFDEFGQYKYSNHGHRIPHDDIILLCDFYKRPWFGRTWVVQEVALAPESVCHFGRHSRPMQEVLQVARWLEYTHRAYELSYQDSFGFQKAAVLQHIVDQLSDRNLMDEGFEARVISLRACLENLKDFAASDARDKIYGTLGLIESSANTSAIPTLIAPNYTKSIRETFRDATRFAIADEGNLALFRIVRHRSISKDVALSGTMPSWVPRWSRPLNSERDPWAFHSTHIFPNRMRTLEDDVLAGIGEPDILTIGGTVIDSCVKAGPEWTGYLTTSTRILAFLNRCSRMTAWLLGSADRPTQIQALARVLIGGTTWDNRCGCLACYPYGAADMDDLIQGLANPSMIADRARRPEWENKWRVHSALGNAIVRACRNRRFFVGSKYIGIGPFATKKGDMICLLSGASFPLVLRPCGQEFYLIGECYVDGPSLNECLDKWNAGQMVNRRFRIK